MDRGPGLRPRYEGSPPGVCHGRERPGRLRRRPGKIPPPGRAAGRGPGQADRFPPRLSADGGRGEARRGPLDRPRPRAARRPRDHGQRRQRRFRRQGPDDRRAHENGRLPRSGSGGRSSLRQPGPPRRERDARFLEPPHPRRRTRRGRILFRRHRDHPSLSQRIAPRKLFQHLRQPDRRELQRRDERDAAEVRERPVRDDGHHGQGPRGQSRGGPRPVDPGLEQLRLGPRWETPGASSSATTGASPTG